MRPSDANGEEVEAETWRRKHTTNHEGRSAAKPQPKAGTRVNGPLIPSVAKASTFAKAMVDRMTGRLAFSPDGRREGIATAVALRIFASSDTFWA